MPLIVFGLSHRKTPIEVLEKAVIAENHLPGALADFGAKTGAAEAAILATCNRCEIYGIYQEPDPENAIAGWLSGYCGVPGEKINSCAFAHRDADAARHLMRVASSMDSMIIGEAQILGQVKSAYRVAQDRKSAGPVLSRLFESAISVAKKIRATTALGKYPVSYGTAIIKACGRLFEHLAEKNVLLIGTGKMIRPIARHFSEQNIASMSIAGRSADKANEIAAENRAYVISFDKISEVLYRQDIVVSCTGSTSPILHKATVLAALSQRRHRPMIMIDMAVPRDLDEQIKDLPDVYLYNLGDLARVIDENRQVRLAAAAQAETTIMAKADEYAEWLEARKAAHTISSYLIKAGEIRAQALENSMKTLRAGTPPEAVLKELAKSLTGKLVHPMLEVLKQTSGQKKAGLPDIIKEQFDPDKKTE